jgi:hypothetical protein
MIDGLPSFTRLSARESDVPGVWFVSLPMRPWKRAAAEAELGLMIDRLASALPARALWLSDWASDDKAGWHLLSAEAPWKAFERDLSQGAWALFFFGSASAANSVFSVRPAQPRSAAAAVKALQDLRAGAGIWSWMDDTEWLVAVSSSLPITPPQATHRPSA